MLAQDPANAFARYGLAMEYSNNGQEEKAVEHFKAVIDLNPNYTYAYFHGGRTLEKLGRMEEAAALYQQGIDISTRIGDRKALGELQAALDLLPI